MFNFLKKKTEVKRMTENKKMTDKKFFCSINGEIYRIYIPKILKEDEHLSIKELLSEYSFDARRYDKLEGSWGWNTTYDFIQEFYMKYSISETDADIIEINEKDVDNVINIAVNKLKSEMEMKFNDIKVNTIYTHKTYNFNASFLRDIVMVRKKIIDELSDNVNNSFLIEIETYDTKELLDKNTTNSTRKIITFYTFLHQYEIGCKYKIVESNDGMTSIEDYLKSNEIK